MLISFTKTWKIVLTNAELEELGCFYTKMGFFLIHPSCLFVKFQKLCKKGEKWLRTTKLRKHLCKNIRKSWARPGFEPGTTRTLSGYHTPRPTSHGEKCPKTRF